MKRDKKIKTGRLKIVADENILLVEEIFRELGTVQTMPGRLITAESVAEADVLLVRSVTTVNEILLEGSTVAFVGSATIGVDHLDTDYLDEAGIHYASAPGCNARAVVEYVFSAVFSLAQRNPSFFPLQKTWGVLGCGNVGSTLVRQLQGLNQEVVAYDPFLSADSHYPLVTIDEALSQDIICLHTPLTTDGLYPTHQLLTTSQLLALKKDAVLINCGRGAVIDNEALLAVLKQRPDLKVVLDVWETEPAINLELLSYVDLATPHIAGYSVDGKLNGSLMIYEALKSVVADCNERERADLISPVDSSFLFNPKAIESFSGSVAEQLSQTILTAYDVFEDDKILRHALLDEKNDPACEFDRLRKEYILRTGFQHHCVQLSEEAELTAEVKIMCCALEVLGFKID